MTGAHLPTVTSWTTTTVSSPVGPLRLVAADGALAGLYMDEHRHAPPVASHWRRDRSVFAQAAAELDEYFTGQRTGFTLRLHLVGTDFQRRVWSALREIPYGSTVTYGELASAIGRPNAPRAVGLANGRNPVSIVVPCHRVIGAGGALTGYGGGTERKAALLAIEQGRTRSTVEDA